MIYFCVFGKVAHVLNMLVFPNVFGFGGVLFFFIWVWKV